MSFSGGRYEPWRRDPPIRPARPLAVVTCLAPSSAAPDGCDGERRHPAINAWAVLHRKAVEVASGPGSAGRATSDCPATWAHSGQVGSAPAATARSQARPTAVRTCSRSGTGLVCDGVGISGTGGAVLWLLTGGGPSSRPMVAGTSIRALRRGTHSGPSCRWSCPGPPFGDVVHRSSWGRMVQSGAVRCGRWRRIGRQTY